MRFGSVVGEMSAGLLKPSSSEEVEIASGLHHPNPSSEEEGLFVSDIPASLSKAAYGPQPGSA